MLEVPDSSGKSPHSSERAHTAEGNGMPGSAEQISRDSEHDSAVPESDSVTSTAESADTQTHSPDIQSTGDSRVPTGEHTALNWRQVASVMECMPCGNSDPENDNIRKIVNNLEGVTSIHRNQGRHP